MFRLIPHWFLLALHDSNVPDYAHLATGTTLVELQWNIANMTNFGSWKIGRGGRFKGVRSLNKKLTDWSFSWARIKCNNDVRQDSIADLSPVVFMSALGSAQGGRAPFLGTRLSLRCISCMKTTGVESGSILPQLEWNRIIWLSRNLRIVGGSVFYRLGNVPL